MTSVTDSDAPCGTELQILKAAEAEFMTKGFAGARTTAIAQAAGVTHAMLHYYFRTKEKLFERIIADKIGLLQTLLADSLCDSSMSLHDKIRTIIGKHLDFIACNPDLPGFIVREVFSDPARMAILTDRIRTYVPVLTEKVQAALDEAAAAGVCRKVDARMLLIDIVSLNIFSYMAYPLVNMLGVDVGSAAFLEARKHENYDTIMLKLKPE